MADNGPQQNERVQSFVCWNTIGSVGKSTLAFNVVCEYALQFPKKKFLVIDMCPQANCSAYFLGGGSDGPTALEKLTNERRTISAYISLETEPHNMFKYQDFLVHPHEYNDKVPQNVFLLCGDHSLDLIAPAIERMANEIPIRGTRDPFKEIHSIVKRFVEAVTKEGEWIVWVDTNPAFTIYTRIALCTCQQLIVPCNPDEFSVSAVTVITDLLRGSNAPSAYNVTTFAKLAKQHSLELPKLRLVIANRFHVREGNTPQDGEKRLADTFLSVLRKQENLDFVLPLTITKANQKEILTGRTITTEDFAQYYTTTVPPFHGAGVYSSFSGVPLSTMVGEKCDGLSILMTSSWALQDIVAHLHGSVVGFQEWEATVKHVKDTPMGIKTRESKITVNRKRPVPSYDIRVIDCIKRWKSQIELKISESSGDTASEQTRKRKITEKE